MIPYNGELGYNEIMRLKHIFFFLALILIVLFGIVQFGQLTNFLSVIRSVNVWLLLVVIVLRYMYYWTNTKYFQVYLKNFNYRVPFGLYYYKRTMLDEG